MFTVSRWMLICLMISHPTTRLQKPLIIRFITAVVVIFTFWQKRVVKRWMPTTLYLFGPT
ncbi:hypothetical protein HY26_08370 [Hyphomonas sp. GM-8P]|nr:hypothetical protein HY26_08370 [Hyphomonas sp. GM-8P]